jgi:peptide/nickel transport system permease protein
MHEGGGRAVGYLRRRIGFYVFALWASVTLNFLIPHLMPGNPAELMVAKFKGKLTPQALKAFMAAFGINLHTTLWQNYLNYLWALIHLRLGVSYAYFPDPVAAVIGAALPWTIGLVGISTVIGFLVGTYLGIVSAWRRGGVLDAVLPVGFTFLNTFPYFFTALLILYLFAFVEPWFPTGQAFSSFTESFSLPFILDVVHHAVLPAFTLIVGSLGGWLLGMRNNMISTLSADYVVLAEAKGLPDRQVMWRYAARNAMLPNLTGFALSLGFIVSGAILVEVVFSYPGVGSTLLTAVTSEDYPLVQALLLIISLTVLVANFAADMLYGYLDPRARTGGGAAE